MNSCVYFNEKKGVFYEKIGNTARIYWSPQMISELKRMYPVNYNSEVAECLGVSKGTLCRKVKELGLKKDAEYMRVLKDTHVRMAFAAYKAKGMPTAFKKGESHNFGTMFKKGHTETDEIKKKRILNLKRYNLTHPAEVSNRILKMVNTKLKKRYGSAM